MTIGQRRAAIFILNEYKRKGADRTPEENERYLNLLGDTVLKLIQEIVHLTGEKDL